MGHPMFANDSEPTYVVELRSLVPEFDAKERRRTLNENVSKLGEQVIIKQLGSSPTLTKRILLELRFLF